MPRYRWHYYLQRLFFYCNLLLINILFNLIMENNFVKIGHIHKAKGLKGEVKLSFEDFFFDAFDTNEELALFFKHFFIEVKAQKVPFFVEYLNTEANVFILKVEDISSKESAEQQIEKRDIFIEASLLANANIDTSGEVSEWEVFIGFKLIDANTQALIGSIEDVIFLPGHELIEVKYKQKTVLLPIHQDLITHTDKRKKTITLQIANGLLD